MAGIFGLLMSGAGLIKDQYFNRVSLLLPGNGTNGAQNNTFLDSSTNNFTITRNGNTTQGTFSPFSQTGWGNYFSTSSAGYFYVPDSTPLNLSGGAYTIEGWINPEGSYTTSGSYSGYNAIISKRVTGGSSSSAWEVFLSVTTGALAFYNGTIYTGSTTPTAGQWNHFAAVYDGTNLSLYLNGNRVLAPTAVTNTNYSANIVIGSYDAGGGNFEQFRGYISNLRVTKGAALYSGTTYTVPTSALTTTVSSGTVSLLTCQNNRFVDNANNATVTVSGSPRVVAFSPFAPTAAYTTAAVGGSGYFDGTGDYLTWAGSSVGSGAFTFECWFYYTGTFAGTSAFIGPGTATTNALSIQISSSTTIQIDQYGVTATSFTVPTMTANQWYHLAVVRNSGGSCTVFLNGTRSSTGALSITTNFANVAAIGYVSSAVARHWIGYLAGVTYNSTALYDPTLSTITIPTAPTTAVSGTQLLLNFTNAGITDATAKNDLETVGNAQISTSVSKFGGGSIYFDGNNDSLNGPSSTELDMGTGNWTVEGWINITTRTLNYPLIIGNNNGSFSAGAVAFTASNADLVTYNDRFNLAIFDLGVTKLIPATGTANATGTWYHFAVVRNGTNISIYRDGVSVASATVSASLTINWGKGGVRVGGNNWDGAQSYLNGYIDDLRLTKGLARYTANFTPPTAPYPVQ